LVYKLNLLVVNALQDDIVISSITEICRVMALESWFPSVNDLCALALGEHGLLCFAGKVW